MLISTGDITQDYKVIGLVFGYALEEAKGCKSEIANLAVFQRATEKLQESAAAIGGDALTFVGFQQRDTMTAGCGNSGKAAVEVYAFGTAVKLL